MSFFSESSSGIGICMPETKGQTKILSRVSCRSYHWILQISPHFLFVYIRGMPQWNAAFNGKRFVVCNQILKIKQFMKWFSICRCRGFIFFFPWAIIWKPPIFHNSLRRTVFNFSFLYFTASAFFFLFFLLIFFGSFVAASLVFDVVVAHVLCYSYVFLMLKSYEIK